MLPAPSYKPDADSDGKFSFSEIYNYLCHDKYPEGTSKAEKNSLRRRVKYFRIRDENLNCVGGGEFELMYFQ